MTEHDPVIDRDAITPEFVKAHRPGKIDAPENADVNRDGAADGAADGDFDGVESLGGIPVGEEDGSASDLVRLFTPETRFRVLDALVGNDHLPVSEIVDTADVSQASANRHLRQLEEYGIVEQVDKVGNAVRWRACPDHPVVQLLRMADSAVRFGVTPDLLDERFVGQPGADYEPGDHENDPR